MLDATTAIDLDCFPIDQMKSGLGEALLKDTQQKLASDGCAVLKNFVKPEAVEAMVKEADRAAPNGHGSKRSIWSLVIYRFSKVAIRSTGLRHWLAKPCVM